MTIGARPGDWVEVELNGCWANNAPTGLLDVATVTVGGSPINYVSSGTSLPVPVFGVPSWSDILGATFSRISGTIRYQLQPADIQFISGAGALVAILQLRNVCSTNAGKTLYMAAVPFVMSVRKAGEPSISGATP